MFYYYFFLVNLLIYSWGEGGGRETDLGGEGNSPSPPPPRPLYETLLNDSCKQKQEPSIYRKSSPSPLPPVDLPQILMTLTHLLPPYSPSGYTQAVLVLFLRSPRRLSLLLRRQAGVLALPTHHLHVEPLCSELCTCQLSDVEELVQLALLCHRA